MRWKRAETTGFLSQRANYQILFRSVFAAGFYSKFGGRSLETRNQGPVRDQYGTSTGPHWVTTTQQQHAQNNEPPNRSLTPGRAAAPPGSQTWFGSRLLPCRTGCRRWLTGGGADRLSEPSHVGSARSAAPPPPSPTDGTYVRCPSPAHNTTYDIITKHTVIRQM